MKKVFVILAAIIGFGNCVIAQNNLDFEFGHNLRGVFVPYNWYAGNGGIFKYGDEKGYKVYLDSLERHSGKYSLKMEMTNESVVNGFGVFTGTFYPIEDFAGKTVEYRGWIKTKNVRNGYAGLWLRIDGADKNVLGFDNMHNRGLHGDNVWTQVSMKFEVSKDAKNINFGGLFTGEGTVWFDNLELYIDGKKY